MKSAKTIWFSSVLFFFLGMGVVFLASKPPVVSANEATEENIIQRIQQKIFPVRVPPAITFAGEPVPLTAFDVKERLDREMMVNTYWHSNTLQLFKLSARYFPVIEPILAEEGVPDDFKYLAAVESGFRNVVSPAKAEGFWQFLSATGKEQGLEITLEVDERYHLEKATVAACRYLKKAKEKTGSWTLAAAGYNMGVPGIKGQIDKQKVDSYYDLLLNEETSRYVFRILAVKELFQNREKYGFFLEEEDLYRPVSVKTVVVDSTIVNLADFALEQGTNYKTLKLLNPWLRKNALTNPAKKKYEIKLPV